MIVEVKCRVQRPARECLRWVKRVVLTVGCSLPVYPDERTYSESVGTSQRCQFQTHAQRHRSSYSITLSAVASRFSGTLVEGMPHRSELAQETSRPFRAKGKRV